MFKRIVLILFFLTMVVFAQNWIITQVDSSIYGDLIYDSSIGLDSNAYPHIIYPLSQLVEGEYSFWLKFAKWYGNVWNFCPVDSVTNGAFTTGKLCMGYENCLHIVYLMYNAQYNYQVRYAYWNGLLWRITVIDSFFPGPGGNYNIQRNLDLTLDQEGLPHLCFPKFNSTDSMRTICYAYRSADSWIVRTIWRTRKNTRRCRIGIDTAGIPVIIFDVNSTNDTSFLYCARPNGDTWDIKEVDRTWNASIDPFDLVIDADNRIHLLYSRDFGVFYALKQNDTWTIEWTGIMIDNTSNHGGMVIDNFNNPRIICSSPLTPPTYAYKEGAIWHYEIISSQAGLYPDIAIDRQGNIHVSYVRFGYPSYLCYAQRITPGIEDENRELLFTNRLLLKIFPNPASSYFVVHISSSLRQVLGSDYIVKIFDATGKMIKEEKLKGLKDDRILLAGIKNGVYFIRVEDMWVKQKLIITK